MDKKLSSREGKGITPEQNNTTVGQQASGEELLRAYFLIDFLPPPTTGTPEPPGPVPAFEDKARENRAYNASSQQEVRDYLRRRVRQIVQLNLGDECQVSELNIRRGTLVVEFSVLLVAGRVVYDFIKNYPDFRQGVIQLTNDLKAVIQQVYKQLAPGPGDVTVYGRLIEAPATSRAVTVRARRAQEPQAQEPQNTAAMNNGHPSPPRPPDDRLGPLVWYLLISNAALILFLILLLIIWTVASVYVPGS